MENFLKLLGHMSDETAENMEHAIIIHFNYGQPSLDPLHALEDKLRTVVVEAQAGEYDGHEIAMALSDGFLYMYGPDAYKLYTAVEPVLENSPFMIGATACLRFGPPAEGVREELIIIKPRSIC